MRITKFAVQDFLSLRKTGEVTLDPSITVLLGMNEHGKTNLLLALDSFDREREYEADDLCSYSENHEQIASGRAAASDVPIITLWFEVERGDGERLAAVDEGLRKAKTVKGTKYLDNHYEFEVDGTAVASVRAGDEWPEVIELKEAAESIGASLDAKLRQHAERYAPFGESLDAALESLRSFKERCETTEGGLESGAPELRAALIGLPNQDQPIVDDVRDAMDSLDEIAQAVVDARAATPRDIGEELLGSLPRFVYFEDVAPLEDSVAIDDFLANRSKYPTLASLVSLVGLDVERLKSEGFHSRAQATEVASREITGRVNESWKQEKVTVWIKCDGENLGVIVSDNKGGFDPPSKRSKGFRWYLCFYINFYAGSKQELRNTVLLLDDPGVFLHVSGQKDLLNTIEALSKDNQFVIATHSPFLIDREHLDRIRIVEKQEEQRGTIIKEKWYDSGSDAFEPIRAALGMVIGDTLFTLKENVIVEGISDFYILSGMARACEGAGRDFLDEKRVAFIAVKGAPSVPDWVLFLFKQGLGVVGLLDHDDEGRRALRSIREEMDLPEYVAMTLEAFKSAEECQDVDLEDLIDADTYHSAFVAAYTPVLQKKGTAVPAPQELQPAQCSRTKPYEEYFKSNKLGRFDKAMVGKQLMLMCSSVNGGVGASTIDGFSRLFESIQALFSAKK